ncbi:MAG: LacI family DNA-binding transcriptional regulator [Fimbriimonadaceae bacterium]
MRTRVTIADVARRAQVSKVTVSYVLNGRGGEARISPETASRVLAAARELNYSPNAVARMLVTKRTDVLAVVFQRGHFFSTWSSFIAEVMRGVSSAAVESGYDLMLHTKDVSPESEAFVLSDGRVDGALVLRDEGDPILDGLLAAQLPFVQFFTRTDRPDCAYVDADNYAGGRLATRHLIDLGHRKIAMVRGSLRSTSSNDRFNGYRDALETAGIGVAPERVVSIPTPASDFEVFTRLLESPDKPTAVFVWSDEIAFRCMEAARDLGLSIPDDLSVVGFDSLEACNRSAPPLTSVRQPVFEMAREATRALVAMIRDPDAPRPQMVFPLTLDVRSSTAPPRGGNAPSGPRKRGFSGNC